ncbi:MAG: 4-(cytidine 5'-diphospho)-2-C-methyl-D-erythritol kinase [Clostridia bacterium]|nr:4-(cytidine 5'-diphospho)-2-C-methyl-D-erythritol kinase [Clostridia bacterium]
MNALTLRAPAKINLTLDILGCRPDGYHELRTVMQTVDLADTVTLKRTEGGGIALSLSDPALPCDRRNTAYAAAEVFFAALRERGGEPFGVWIHVTKTIPQQAGMAGGSADAAAVLRGLNRLAGDPFSRDTLCALGAKIGADVPFCVRGGAALATGIGERLTPVPGLPETLTVVVCKPPVGVSTGAAYNAVDAALSAVTPSDEAGLLAALQAGDPAAVGARLHNAFEQALSIPEVTAILARMRAFSPLGCRMTGSGSAVFALFSDEAAARACADALFGAADDPPAGDVFLCRPLSPLF